MSADETLKDLGSKGGRKKLLAEAVWMVRHSGAERIDVERSKALRQGVELAHKMAESEELPKLAKRMEDAAARMEAERLGAGNRRTDPEPDPAVPGDMGEVH